MTREVWEQLLLGLEAEVTDRVCGWGDSRKAYTTLLNAILECESDAAKWRESQRKHAELKAMKEKVFQKRKGE